jgi:hypothetical protein
MFNDVDRKRLGRLGRGRLHGGRLSGGGRVIAGNPDVGDLVGPALEHLAVVPHCGATAGDAERGQASHR